MAEPWWNDVEEDPTHEAAAEWFARLQRSDISAEKLLAWQRWLAADVRNAEAFARIETVCALLRDVPRPDTRIASDAGRPPYDGTETISAWGMHRRSRRWIAIAASLAAALLLAAVWVARIFQSDASSAPAVLQTRVGENRTVVLADGSQVTLGGDTTLRASLGLTARHIVLTRGEAFFAVAKDPTRPFSVQAGNATVKALGTQFDVRRRASRVDVMVVQGEVVVERASDAHPGAQTSDGAAQSDHSDPQATADVRTAQTSGTDSVRLAAGQRAVVGDSSVQSTSHVGDAAVQIAWHSGRLVFERERLREVIEDVNRYSRRRLSIQDPDVGELLFTGTVVNGNVEGWLASIEEVFSLEAVEQSDQIVLRRRRAQ